MFGHVERMERDRIAKRVYVEEDDTVMEYLRERGLDVRQATKLVLDKNQWREYVRGNAWGVAQGMNP